MTSCVKTDHERSILISLVPVIYSELLFNDSRVIHVLYVSNVCVSTNIGYNDACNQFPQEGKRSTFSPSSRFPRVGFRSVVISELHTEYARNGSESR